MKNVPKSIYFTTILIDFWAPKVQKWGKCLQFFFAVCNFELTKVCCTFDSWVNVIQINPDSRKTKGNCNHALFFQRKKDNINHALFFERKVSVPKVWVLGVPGWEDDLAQAEDTVVFNTVEAPQVRSEIDIKMWQFSIHLTIWQCKQGAEKRIWAAENKIKSSRNKIIKASEKDLKKQQKVKTEEGKKNWKNSRNNIKYIRTR